MKTEAKAAIFVLVLVAAGALLIAGATLLEQPESDIQTDSGDEDGPPNGLAEKDPEESDEDEATVLDDETLDDIITENSILPEGDVPPDSYHELHSSCLEELSDGVDIELRGLPSEESFYEDGIKHVNVDTDVHGQMLVRAACQRTVLSQADVDVGFSFDDRLEESGIEFEHDVVPDRAENLRGNHYHHGNGVSVADVTGNGYQDIYFTNQLGANELWANQGDGTFRNITEEAGVAVSDSVSVSASFADLDNDGYPDLYVSVIRDDNRLFENQGDGTFEDVSERSNLGVGYHSAGAVFFDYNQNGYLDMFLTNVGEFTTERESDVGHYVGRERRDVDEEEYGEDGHMPWTGEYDEPNLLFENQGDMTFEDVTEDVGIDDVGWSGDAVPTYFEGNEHPGLYVLNMEGADSYYRNEGGEEFVEANDEVFGSTPFGSMGVTQLDHDRDGEAALYVTDRHSDRTVDKEVWEEHEHVKYGEGETDILPYRGILGNAFYEFPDRGSPDERAVELNLQNYQPWGPASGDVNANGYEDLYVTAGMNLGYRYQPSYMLMNDGGVTFVHAEFELGLEPRDDLFTEWLRLDCSGEDRDHPRCSGYDEEVAVMSPEASRGNVVFDVDGDGALDIVALDFNSEPRVMMNDIAEEREINYLKVDLRGVESNRDGLGSRVVVRVDEGEQVKYHDGQSGYHSQSSKPLYFGLGSHEEVEEVQVDWPSGRTEIYPVSETNQLVTLKEDGEIS